jgi:hypothetical protein
MEPLKHECRRGDVKLNMDVKSCESGPRNFYDDVVA